MRFTTPPPITGLTVFVSLIFWTATASFGQVSRYVADPARRTTELIYTQDQEKKANPNVPATTPPGQPGTIVEQLKQLAAQQKSRLDTLLRAVELAFNALSGNETNLLSGNRPELLSKNNTSLLSGNSPELLSGNSPKLLSGNKPKILSDNQTPILSGNHLSLSILSDIKIEVHIENTGNNSGNHAPPPPAGSDLAPLHAAPERR